MKAALSIFLQDRPIWVGAFGTVGTVMLDHIHLIVGIAVGLTTITYLIIRICKEMRE